MSEADSLWLDLNGSVHGCNCRTSNHASGTGYSIKAKESEVGKNVIVGNSKWGEEKCMSTKNSFSAVIEGSTLSPAIRSWRSASPIPVRVVMTTVYSLSPKCNHLSNNNTYREVKVRSRLLVLKGIIQIMVGCPWQNKLKTYWNTSRNLPLLYKSTREIWDMPSALILS